MWKRRAVWIYISERDFSPLSVTALKHKSKLYSPSQDLVAICGRSQWEHTEPPLIWTTKHNSTHTHTHRQVDTAAIAPLLNHTVYCMSSHTKKLDERTTMLLLGVLWVLMVVLCWNNDLSESQSNTHTRSERMDVEVTRSDSIIHPGDNEGPAGRE